MSFSPSWALHPFLSLGAYQLPFDLRSLIFGGCRLWGSLSILGGSQPPWCFGGCAGLRLVVYQTPARSQPPLCGGDATDFPLVVYQPPAGLSLL